MKKKRFWIYTLLVLGVVIGGAIVIPDTTLYVDEVVHYEVIKNFCNLKSEISPNLTNIPAYHGAIGLLCYLGSWFGKFDTLSVIRSLSLGLGLLGLWVVYKTAEHLNHKQPGLKTLQVFFLPVSYVFFFLAYTDIPALMLVILGFYLVLKKKYGWAGLVSILSVAFRQNNIVWMGWLAVLVYLQEYGWKLGIREIWGWLKKIWLFVMGVVLFGVFVYTNGGISLAKAEEWAHPAFSLYVGNIYLMLLYFFVVFLPEILKTGREGIKRLKGKWGWLLASILGFLVVYLLRFENTHPYNQHTFALHNLVLVKMTASRIMMLLALIPMILALGFLFTSRLKEKKYYLLYLFAVAFVIPSWLIEPRYYIVPFSLYLLVREEKNKKEEWALLGWEILLGGGILVGTAAKMLFS